MFNHSRRVFTPQNLAIVRRMAEQGCSAPEIAKALGSTPSSVRVTCSRQQIRLRRGRGDAARPPLVQRPVDYEGRGVPVVAYLAEPLYAEFRRRANDVQKPASAFASMLLSAIAESDLYKAVLDE
jgi:hypothetical protein